MAHLPLTELWSSSGMRSEQLDKGESRHPLPATSSGQFGDRLFLSRWTSSNNSESSPHTQCPTARERQSAWGKIMNRNFLLSTFQPSVWYNVEKKSCFLLINLKALFTEQLQLAWPNARHWVGKNICKLKSTFLLISHLKSKRKFESRTYKDLIYPPRKGRFWLI